jgi:hypothetical protein
MKKICLTIVALFIATSNSYADDRCKQFGGLLNAKEYKKCMANPDNYKAREKKTILETVKNPGDLKDAVLDPPKKLLKGLNTDSTLTRWLKGFGKDK